MAGARRDRAGDVACGGRCGCGASADRDPRSVERVRRGGIVRIACRSGSARSWRAPAPMPGAGSGAVLGRRLRRRAVRWIFHRRHRRRAAGVEQRHRHLERAEHDHDHARADQQRADLGGDVRRLLVAPCPCRRPWPWRGLVAAFAAGLFGGGAAAAACAARRAAAMKLDELTGSLAAGGNFADRVLGCGDALRRRRHSRGRPRARLERMIGRQIGCDRRARRGGDAASRISLIARGGIGGAIGRRRGLGGMEFARRGGEMLRLAARRDSAIPASAAARHRRCAAAAQTLRAASRAGLRSRTSARGGPGCGAGGAARTARRSPSIIARRSTTWPSVL